MHRIFDSAQFELIRPVAFAFAFPSPPPPPPSDFHSITFSTIPHHFYQPDQTSYRLSFPTFFPLQSIPIHIHLLILHDFFLFIDLFWWLQFFFFANSGWTGTCNGGPHKPNPLPPSPLAAQSKWQTSNIQKEKEEKWTNQQQQSEIKMIENREGKSNKWEIFPHLPLGYPCHSFSGKSIQQ